MADQKDSLDESLNFLSTEFDPLRALYAKQLQPPVPNIQVFNNLVEYARVIKEGKSTKSSASQQNALTRETSEPSQRTRNLKPEFKPPDIQSRLEAIASGVASQAGVHRGLGKVDGAGLSQDEALGKGRGWKNKYMNVLEKMDACAVGPLSILYKCLEKRYKVQVWIRKYKGLRSVLTGYVIAFDKHLNLALMDVDEVFTVEERLEKTDKKSIGTGKKKKKKKKKKRKAKYVTPVETSQNKENILPNSNPISSEDNAINSSYSSQLKNESTNLLLSMNQTLIQDTELQLANTETSLVQVDDVQQGTLVQTTEHPLPSEDEQTISSITTIEDNKRDGISFSSDQDYVSMMKSSKSADKIENVFPQESEIEESRDSFSIESQVPSYLFSHDLTVKVPANEDAASREMEFTVVGIFQPKFPGGNDPNELQSLPQTLLTPVPSGRRFCVDEELGTVAMGDIEDIKTEGKQGEEVDLKEVEMIKVQYKELEDKISLSEGCQEIKITQDYMEMVKSKQGIELESFEEKGYVTNEDKNNQEISSVKCGDISGVNEVEFDMVSSDDDVNVHNEGNKSNVTTEPRLIDTTLPDNGILATEAASQSPKPIEDIKGRLPDNGILATEAASQSPKPIEDIKGRLPDNGILATEAASQSPKPIEDTKGRLPDNGILATEAASQSPKPIEDIKGRLPDNGILATEPASQLPKPIEDTKGRLPDNGILATEPVSQSPKPIEDTKGRLPDNGILATEPVSQLPKPIEDTKGRLPDNGILATEPASQSPKPIEDTKGRLPDNGILATEPVSQSPKPIEDTKGRLPDNGILATEPVSQSPKPIEDTKGRLPDNGILATEAASQLPKPIEDTKGRLPDNGILATEPVSQSPKPIEDTKGRLPDNGILATEPASQLPKPIEDTKGRLPDNGILATEPVSQSPKPIEDTKGRLPDNGILATEPVSQSPKPIEDTKGRLPDNGILATEPASQLPKPIEDTKGRLPDNGILATKPCELRGEDHSKKSDVEEESYARESVTEEDIKRSSETENKLNIESNNKKDRKKDDTSVHKEVIVESEKEEGEITSSDEEEEEVPSKDEDKREDKQDKQDRKQESKRLSVWDRLGLDRRVTKETTRSGSDKEPGEQARSTRNRSSKGRRELDVKTDKDTRHRGEKPSRDKRRDAPKERRIEVKERRIEGKERRIEGKERGPEGKERMLEGKERRLAGKEQEKRRRHESSKSKEHQSGKETVDKKKTNQDEKKKEEKNSGRERPTKKKVSDRERFSKDYSNPAHTVNEAGVRHEQGKEREKTKSTAKKTDKVQTQKHVRKENEPKETGKDKTKHERKTDQKKTTRIVEDKQTLNGKEKHIKFINKKDQVLRTRHEKTRGVSSTSSQDKVKSSKCSSKYLPGGPKSDVDKTKSRSCEQTGSQCTTRENQVTQNAQLTSKKDRVSAITHTKTSVDSSQNKVSKEKNIENISKNQVKVGLLPTPTVDGRTERRKLRAKASRGITKRDSSLSLRKTGETMSDTRTRKTTEFVGNQENPANPTRTRRKRKLSPGAPEEKSKRVKGYELREQSSGLKDVTEITKNIETETSESNRADSGGMGPTTIHDDQGGECGIVRRVQASKGKLLVFKRRHVNQLFVRGDNVVMISYAS